MKKVLYLTNIEVPYRVRFFNELSKHCELTVLYEKKTIENRNEIWARSEEKHHIRKFLKNNGSIFFSGILKEIRRDYDAIIVGCYNNPLQMIAMIFMRIMKIPFIINLDGEVFLNGTGIKTKLKKFFLYGADKYLVAGEKAARSLKEIARDKEIIPYYFSSLSEEELLEHRTVAQYIKRNNTVLVVGQYYNYKGMDIALQAAKMDLSVQYKFVGMGSRTALFAKEHEIPSNVELIPFLQKEDLAREYTSSAMLVLPSRQECWGLVINEAASFGTPIISTWGSGAAVEFLSDQYSQYLAEPNNPEDLYRKINSLINESDIREYRNFLFQKSSKYSIEKSVKEHCKGCGIKV